MAWSRRVLAEVMRVVTSEVLGLAEIVPVGVWARPDHYHDGRLTRRARLEFIFRDVDEGDFADFMKKDYAAAVTLFELLNKAHKKEPELSKRQFRVLSNRVQGFANTLLEAAGR